MSSTFGTLFRVSTFGESHGGRVGCVIDGCPPNIPIDINQVQAALHRRRPGQSSITTPRKEADQIEVHSGIFEGKTLGTPIAMSIQNKDARSNDYKPNQYRPSHADFTTDAKYGHRDWRGGGRASARETAARVAAGSIAAQVLHPPYKHSDHRLGRADPRYQSRYLSSIRHTRTSRSQHCSLSRPTNRERNDCPHRTHPIDRR